MIPRVVHLYWGRNRPLSFLRWLTAASFAHHNPEWSLRVYAPLTPSLVERWPTGEQQSDPGQYEDWFPRLKEIRNLRVISVRADPNISEVHRSDLLRWNLLWEEGGVWSDFDILYHAPLGPEFDSGRVLLCYQLNRNGRAVASIGFLASAPGEPFFRRVSAEAHRRYTACEYQAAGCFALEGIPWGAEVRLLAPQTVYPVGAGQARRLYEEGAEIRGTVGTHWFAGFLGAAPFQAMGPEGLAASPVCIAKMATAVWEDLR